MMAGFAAWPARTANSTQTRLMANIAASAAVARSRGGGGGCKRLVGPRLCDRSGTRHTSLAVRCVRQTDDLEHVRVRIVRQGDEQFPSTGDRSERAG